MGTGVLSQEWGQHVLLTTDLHPMPGVRMGKAVPLVTISAFVVWTGTTVHDTPRHQPNISELLVWVRYIILNMKFCIFSCLSTLPYIEYEIWYIFLFEYSTLYWIWNLVYFLVSVCYLILNILLLEYATLYWIWNFVYILVWVRYLILNMKFGIFSYFSTLPYIKYEIFSCLSTLPYIEYEI